jgi:RNA polymerase sigma-70 factor (ECF subfamily)
MQKGIGLKMNKEQFTTKVLDAEKSLYHVAKSILWNDEDCADAMQNAILKAFSKLQDLKNESFFKTWITRILMNECYQIIRNRKDEILYEDYFEQQEGTDLDQYSEVYLAVSGMEESYRIPFVLFYIEGYSIQEIGQILKLSKSTVKTRLYRSRLLLKDKLKGEYGYEGYENIKFQ